MSSARAVRCRVKSHNERNPRRQLPAREGGDSGGTAGASREEGGDDVKSARPPRPGRHTCYSGRHSGPPPREGARIPKAGPGSDRGLQPDPVKLDSLVIAHQPRRGEYVPGPCTHRPSSHGSRGRLKPAPGRGGRGRARRLGLSRNKVAVPEGAAGTPPFWTARARGRRRARASPCPARAAARGAGESRSSAGQSATLIMWRPPVQIRAGLPREGSRAGGLAQLVERLLCKQEAAGSRPAFSTHRSLARRSGRAGPPEGPAPPGRGRRKRRKQRKGKGRGPRAAGGAPVRARPRGASAREAKAGRTADAQAPGGDEGRAQLRKSRARRTGPVTPGCPNGATRPAEGRAPPRGGAHPANRNIPVAGGGGDNSGAPRSGEREGRSPKPGGSSGPPGVVGPHASARPPWPKRLEGRPAGGERPVGFGGPRAVGTLSRAGPEDPRPKRPGPPGKADYSRETDSEPVP